MKTIISSMFLLLCAVLSARAQACNQERFDTNVIAYTLASWSGSPGYQNFTPSVGYISTCRGYHNGQAVAAGVYVYQGCPFSNFYMNGSINEVVHFWPWDPPSNWSLTSSGIANYNNHLQEQWELVADCTCNQSGTFSSNGGFDAELTCN